MYSVGNEDADQIAQLLDAPLPCVGAPMPMILCDEHQLLIAYAVQSFDINASTRNSTNVTPRTNNLDIAVVHFHWKYAHMFGPPNDLMMTGHPLASRGLHSHSVFEVYNSSWIRQLEELNSVHPMHNSQRFFAELRHFIFTFHNSTMECASDGFYSEILRGSMSEVLRHMVVRMDERM